MHRRGERKSRRRDVDAAMSAPRNQALLFWSICALNTGFTVLRAWMLGGLFWCF